MAAMAAEVQRFGTRQLMSAVGICFMRNHVSFPDFSRTSKDDSPAFQASSSLGGRVLTGFKEMFQSFPGVSTCRRLMHDMALSAMAC